MSQERSLSAGIPESSGNETNSQKLNGLDNLRLAAINLAITHTKEIIEENARSIFPMPVRIGEVTLDEATEAYTKAYLQRLKFVAELKEYSLPALHALKENEERGLEDPISNVESVPAGPVLHLQGEEAVDDKTQTPTTDESQLQILDRILSEPAYANGIDGFELRRRLSKLFPQWDNAAKNTSNLILRARERGFAIDTIRVGRNKLFKKTGEPGLLENQDSNIDLESTETELPEDLTVENQIQSPDNASSNHSTDEDCQEPEHSTNNLTEIKPKIPKFISPRDARIFGILNVLPPNFQSNQLVDNLFSKEIETGEISWAEAMNYVTNNVLPRILKNRNPYGTTTREPHPERANTFIYTFTPFNEAISAYLQREFSAIDINEAKLIERKNQDFVPEILDPIEKRLGQKADEERQIRPRLVFTLPFDRRNDYEAVIHVPEKKGKTRTVSLTRAEADLLAVVFELPERIKRDALEMKMTGVSLLDDFSGLKGFTRTLNKLNSKIKVWGVTIGLDQNGDIGFIPYEKPADMQRFTHSDRRNELNPVGEETGKPTNSPSRDKMNL